jgi:hypothetical protein
LILTYAPLTPWSHLPLDCEAPAIFVLKPLDLDLHLHFGRADTGCCQLPALVSSSSSLIYLLDLAYPATCIFSSLSSHQPQSPGLPTFLFIPNSRGSAHPPTLATANHDDPKQPSSSKSTPTPLLQHPEPQQSPRRRSLPGWAYHLAFAKSTIGHLVPKCGGLEVGSWRMEGVEGFGGWAGFWYVSLEFAPLFFKGPPRPGSVLLKLHCSCQILKKSMVMETWLYFNSSHPIPSPRITITHPSPTPPNPPQISAAPPKS